MLFLAPCFNYLNCFCSTAWRSTCLLQQINLVLKNIMEQTCAFSLLRRSYHTSKDEVLTSSSVSLMPVRHSIRLTTMHWKLIDRNVPVYLVCTIVYWFYMLSFRVRWGTTVSVSFSPGNGVPPVYKGSAETDSYLWGLWCRKRHDFVIKRQTVCIFPVTDVSCPERHHQWSCTQLRVDTFDARRRKLTHYGSPPGVWEWQLGSCYSQTFFPGASFGETTATLYIGHVLFLIKHFSWVDSGLLYVIYSCIGHCAWNKQ